MERGLGGRGEKNWEKKAKREKEENFARAAPRRETRVREGRPIPMSDPFVYGMGT